MENRPLVSVVVPIYNVEEYIEKCVDSILNQTYKNLEVILVNDGSTDNSRNIIEKYLWDSRCIVIDKVNGGVSSARNAGLKSAHGEYVYFIDSDDYIESQAVEELLNKIIETSADFCCYRVKFYSGEKYSLYGADFTVDTLTSADEIIRDAFTGKNIKTTAWAKFFNLNFLRENSITFYEGIINEDYLFTLQCAISATKVSFLNVPLYNALQRLNSISRNMKDDNLLVYQKIDSLLSGYLQSKGILDEYRSLLECSLGIQLVYTITQAAYRFDTYSNFRKFYNLLKLYDYNGKLMHSRIKQCGLFRNMVYMLSLKPACFYYTLKIAKRLGLQMI